MTLNRLPRRAAPPGSGGAVTARERAIYERGREDERQSIEARLREPDAAMVEALRWDFHRDRSVALYRAIADAMFRASKGSE